MANLDLLDLFIIMYYMKVQKGSLPALQYYNNIALLLLTRRSTKHKLQMIPVGMSPV